LGGIFKSKCDGIHVDVNRTLKGESGNCFQHCGPFYVIWRDCIPSYVVQMYVLMEQWYV